MNSPPLARAPEHSLTDHVGRAHPRPPADGSSGVAALLDRVAALLRDPEADAEARDRVAAARARALSIAPSGGSELAVVSLLSDLFVTSAVEHAWSPAEAAELFDEIATAAAVSPSFLRTSVCLRALRDPALLELPAPRAIRTVIRVLVALAPVAEAALRRRCADGRLEGVPNAEGAPPRGAVREIPVVCWGRPEAVLVVRPERGRPAAASALAEEAARVLALVLEREIVFDRNAARERSLVAASERRLTRLAFDLHDGPVQDVVALSAEVRHLRDARVGRESPDGADDVRARFDALEAQLLEVGRELRELSSSLEPTSAVRSVPDALGRHVEALRAHGVDAALAVAGDFELLTASQRIAVVRIVQEALANVREHSGAERVRVAAFVAGGLVRVEVTDDGRGFDVAETLSRAARSGRLGLVGMIERVRLLGGRMDVESRPGGPTTVSAALRLWHPVPEREAASARCSTD